MSTCMKWLTRQCPTMRVNDAATAEEIGHVHTSVENIIVSSNCVQTRVIPYELNQWLPEILNAFILPPKVILGHLGTFVKNWLSDPSVKF